MERRSAIEDLKNIANEYAQIYAERYQKVVAQAFIDGMQFFAAVKDKTITDDMVGEELFRTLRRSTDRLINGRN